jgi:hypothetical protein
MMARFRAARNVTGVEWIGHRRSEAPMARIEVRSATRRTRRDRTSFAIPAVNDAEVPGGELCVHPGLGQPTGYARAD